MNVRRLLFASAHSFLVSNCSISVYAQTESPQSGSAVQVIVTSSDSLLAQPFITGGTLLREPQRALQDPVIIPPPTSVTKPPTANTATPSRAAPQSTAQGQPKGSVAVPVVTKSPRSDKPVPHQEAPQRAWQDRVISPWPDPLLAKPPVFATGVVLPDDSRLPDCQSVISSDQDLTLANAIDAALCNNIQVSTAWVQIKQQAAAKGIARASYFPVITGSVGRSKDRTVSDDPESTANRNITNSTTYGNLTWRLFDFGGRAANNRAAEALLDSAIFSHNAAIQKTLATTIASYFEAQTAKILVQSKSLDEKNALQLLSVVKRREKQGLSSASDVMRAQTNAHRASLDRARARGSYEKALLALLYNIGVDPAQFKRQNVAGDLGYIAEPAKATMQMRSDLKDWLAEIKKLHPAIRAANKQVEAANERVISVRSDYLPTVDFTGNYFRNGRPNQSLTLTPTNEVLVAITLNIPIFDGFSKTYQIQNALALAEQKRLDRDEVERFTIVEFLKSYSEFETSLETALSAENFLTSAQGSLESMQRRLESGAADITEVLNVQTALSEARQQRIQTLAELRSARLRLFANAATLGRSQSYFQ